MNHLKKHKEYKQFEKLFEKYYPLLFLVAKKYVQEEQGAKLVAQNIFIDFWEGRAVQEPNISVKSFLYRSVRNQSIQLLQEADHGEDLLENLDHPRTFKAHIVQAEKYQSIQASFHSLMEIQQQIIQLTLKGVQLEEIALVLNLEIGRVKRYKFSGLKLLKTNSKSDFHLALLLVLWDLI